MTPTLYDHCYRVSEKLGEDRYGLHQRVAAIDTAQAPEGGRIQWAFLPAPALALRVRTGYETSPDLGQGLTHTESVAVGAAPGEFQFMLEACTAASKTGGGIVVLPPRNWLLSRLQGSGVELLDVAVSILPALRFHKGKRPRQVTLVRSAFAVQARLEDPEAFSHVLLNGLGRGKAFGLGMAVLV